MTGRRRIHIITHGCQMNKYDSVRMKEILAEEYSDAGKPEDADLIILNTCSVREKPYAKVFAELDNLKPLKKRKPGLILAVAGCVAEQERNGLLEKSPQLDLVFGPDKVDELPGLLSRLEKERRLAATGFTKGPFHLDAHAPLGNSGENGKVTAFVAAQKGCDRFCSYCIVPFVRGREKSRPVGELCEEVGRYVGTGVREVTLLGQNVNDYGRDLDASIDLAGLLSAVAEVDGIRRIRFVTSHPSAMTGRQIEAIAGIEKVCEYLHLPMQAGSDRVLEAMNRGYASGEYFELIDGIRERVPGIALSGDMIVGFPGETDEDFEETLRAVEEVRYDTLFSFMYSPRPRTKAAGLSDTISNEVKHERLTRLQNLQKGITLKANEALVGKVEEVLVEGAAKKGEGDLTGRTRGNKIVNFTAGPELLGSFVKVRITKARRNSLWGEAVDY